MSAIRRAVAEHKGRTAVIAALAVAALGFGVYWFGPQKLFLDERVDEALPGFDGAAADASQDDTAVADDGGQQQSEPPEPTGPVVLARGSFRSLAHESSGRAFVVELPSGDRVLRFEDLDVLNGPDLRVYLAEAPASADDSAFGSDFVDLGGLKGNQGDQNYAIPANVDPDDFRSVAVWCRRFSVGFGVAGLDPVRS